MKKRWKWSIGLGIPVALVVIPAAVLLRPAKLDSPFEVDAENVQLAAFDLTGALVAKSNRKAAEITVEFDPAEAAALLQLASRMHQLRSQPGDPAVKLMISGDSLKILAEVAAPLGVLPVELTLRPEIVAGKLTLNLRRLRFGGFTVPRSYLPKLEARAQAEIPPGAVAAIALAKITPDGGILLKLNRRQAQELYRLLLDR